MTNRLGRDVVDSRMNTSFSIVVTRLAASMLFAWQAFAGELPVPDVEPWLPVAKVVSPAIGEFSGIVASRAHPGVFWTHGDSGNDPLIVAFDSHGKILASFSVAGAPNTDWEDICTDDGGNLYIGDIGNNNGMFPVRYIYKLSEPDPKHPSATPIRFTERWRYKYPDGRRFNCESLFWWEGFLHVIPRADSRSTVVYRVVPEDDGNAKLVALGGLSHMSYATSAAAAADRSRIVVASCKSASVFRVERHGGSDVLFELVSSTSFPNGRGVEACCFDGEDLLLLEEGGSLFRVSAKQLAGNTQFRKPTH